MSDLTRSYRRRLGGQIAMTEDHWKLFLLQGAGLILLGSTAAILANVTALATGALMGWLLLISGLFRLASGLGADIGPGHWSSMLLSTLMILLGAALAFYSQESDSLLTVALAGYFAMHAMASLILASSLREAASPWLPIIVGAPIDVILAMLILSQWPSKSPWVFGVYFGLNLVVAGLALIFVALGVKSRLHHGTSIAQGVGDAQRSYHQSAIRKGSQRDEPTLN